MEKRKYLYIEDLCTNDSKREVWGRVGMDIVTGERIFLVNHAKKPLFDSMGEGAWRPIVIGDTEDEYSIIRLAGTLLPDLGVRDTHKKVVDEIEKSISEHLAYNQSKGLPTEFLEENRKKYSIADLSGDVLYENPYFKVAYSSTNISLYLRNNSFKGMNRSAREAFVQQIQYGIGAMKASSLSVTENDYLLIKSGFRNFAVKQKRENIIGVGELLVADENISPQEEEEALEDLAIEAELIEMYSNYPLSYPDLGRRLDKLTDGAFILSRYNGGTDYFVESLLRVISDEKRASKLLKAVIESLQSREQPEIDEAIKHIREYEKAKSIK